MGVRRVGTKLVAENADQYIRDMESADRATQGMGKTLKGIGLVAAGIAAAKMFAGVAREAISATAAHEQLAMSMTSLVAKEIRTADETLSMSDAMGQASGRAEELLAWIQDLAIKSPFSQEGVASAFRTALAYGFTSNEAQRLTAATIDFATATGQSVGVMNQVALALGQIKAKGKLAGQEILQLVNAGFSVNPILEKMGYTTEDVSKGLVTADKFLLAFTESLESDFGGAAGRSAETINGLIDSLGDLKQVGLRELFGPAIQATLPILSSFVSRVQDLMPAMRTTGQLLGELTQALIRNRESFLVGAVAVGTFFTVMKSGAIITAVSSGITLLTTAVGGLIAALGVLLSPLGLLAIAAGVIVGGLFALRKELTFTANTASSSAGQIAGDWGEMGDKVRQTANQTAEESHSWGYNLVMQFANGMAKAVSAVLQVLTDLGNQIAYWLSPGSPPRIAPDIDKWGSSAMDEFLGGFSSANFDLLKNAGQQMERFLTSGSGGADLGGIADMRKNLRTAVAEFERTGSVSADILNKFDPALRAYTTAMFQAEAANKQVAAAQEALSAVTERYRGILNPLNQELSDIAARRQDIIDQQREAELQSIISDENAPALAKELAQMELREIELNRQIRTVEDQQAAEEAQAQAALDAATQQALLAQEELARQQAILDLRVEDNALLAEQTGLLEGAAVAAGSMAKGLKGAAVAAGSLGSTLAQAFSGFGEGISGKAEQLLEDLKAPFAGIGELWNNLKLAWAGVVLNFLVWSQPLVTKVQEIFMPGGILHQAYANAYLRFNSIKTEFQILVQNMKNRMDELKEKWISFFGEDGTLQTLLKNATDYFQAQWGEGGTWDGIFENMKTAINSLITNALDKLRDGLRDLKGLLLGVYNRLLDLKNLIASTDLSALNPFIANSPAPMAIGLSQINKQMQQFTAKQLPALGKQTAAMDVPSTQSQVTANSVTNYNQQSFNFGGNTLNNGMDMAVFEAAVLQVVNGAL